MDFERTTEGSTPDLEVNRIRARIQALVSERFLTGVTGYYLSQLGADLGEDRKILESITGKKLSTFVEEEFPYELGRTGAHANVLFIKNNTVKSAAVFSAAPRYKARFWAAFAIPLEEGKRRFININSLEFSSDKSDMLLEGGEVREIDSSYTARPDQDDSPQKTIDRIAAWLSEQGLDQSLFVKSRSQKPRDSEESLLDLVLATLSDDQARRVMLPLDVVKKLSIKSVR